VFKDLTGKIAGGAVSLVGGAFILLGLILQGLTGKLETFYDTFVSPEPLSNLFLGLGSFVNVEMTFTVLSLAFAASVLIGGGLLLSGRSLAGGSLVLIFTVLGLLCGGGWGLGFLLAFIGGIIGLASKRKSQTAF
jgi:hypothetical protein